MLIMQAGFGSFVPAFRPAAAGADEKHIVLPAFRPAGDATTGINDAHDPHLDLVQSYFWSLVGTMMIMIRFCTRCRALLLLAHFDLVPAGHFFGV